MTVSNALRMNRKSLVSRITSLSPLIWILSGFLLSYLSFFVRPIFRGNAMHFPAYVPALDSIGYDLAQMLTYSSHWLERGPSPYIGANLYPPLASVTFSPLTFLPFTTAYRVILLATVVSFVFSCTLFPLLVFPRRDGSPLLPMFLVTGLLSYGLQFELERGQFNVVAVACTFLGIYLLHRRPRLRLLSYLLFTLSIQLKIYPVIFTPMFVEDWAAWKSRLPRIVGILALNIAGLFVLGPRTFHDFLAAVARQMADPYIWIGNHSAMSFAVQLLPSRARPLELAILCLFGACFAFAVGLCLARRLKGPDPYLLLVCTVGALVIPSVSHDYTLPLLVAPVAIFLDAQRVLKGPSRFIFVRPLMLTTLTFAYSAILFSYTNRGSFPLIGHNIPPIVTQNSLPAILVVLLSATALVALSFEDNSRAAVPRPSV
jgi:hypothetical protein